MVKKQEFKNQQFLVQMDLQPEPNWSRTSGLRRETAPDSDPGGLLVSPACQQLCETELNPAGRKPETSRFCVKIVSYLKSWQLKHRFSLVWIGKYSSEQIEITCGVPQGSVLGPFLIIIYMLPLTQCNGCSTALFWNFCLNRRYFILKDTSMVTQSDEDSKGARKMYIVSQIKVMKV